MAVKKGKLKTVRRTARLAPTKEIEKIRAQSSSSTAVIVRDPIEVPEESEMSVDQLVAQVEKVHEITERVMKKDVHYGLIPGTPKPTLYQPGAQVLCLAFKLDPQFEQIRQEDGEHLTIFSTCTLFSMVSGRRVASGQGGCSTKEARFAYRQGQRSCPECGKNGTVIKGKAEYGGGWLCYAKKDGCGAKFADNDTRITSQEVGQIENEDIALAWNSVIKQANIRAMRSAVLNATAASDTFTQDMGPDDRGTPRDVNPRQDGGGKSQQAGRGAGASSRPDNDPYGWAQGYQDAMAKDFKANGGDAQPDEPRMGQLYERTAAHNHLHAVIDDYCKSAGVDPAKEGIDILERMSSFVGRDKKMVPGVRDILLLSEKRAIVTRAAIERAIDEKREWRRELRDAINVYAEKNPKEDKYKILEDVTGTKDFTKVTPPAAKVGLKKLKEKYT